MVFISDVEVVSLFQIATNITTMLEAEAVEAVKNPAASTSLVFTFELS